ncbi:MAG TPA: phage holin family protein [Burkholderiales bacterium]|nr:phage holin family protein [Burkholderiales bacterium]
MTEEAGRSEGLLDSLRNLARTFLAIVQTRIEIFASEIDEERTRLARIALLAAAAAFCLGLAVILLVFFLVVLFWDTDRLLAIGVLAGVFAVGGIAACLGLRAAISKRPKFLSATLAELRKDGTRLEGP